MFPGVNVARMRWREACYLDSSLLSLDSFFTPSPEYTQTLTGGLTNRCWKIVTHQDKSYVWRPVTSVTQAFSISRHQEFQILSALYPLKIGPQPVLINEKGLLVEWVPGQAMTAALQSQDLLAMLVRIHAVPTERIAVMPFNFTARVDHYWRQLGPEYQSREHEIIYRRWRIAPEIASAGLALCHFDLAGYNMVSNDDGLFAIDWEYAGLADPRLDLALSLDAEGIGVQDGVSLYCQMRGISDEALWLNGVLAWQPRTKMMALLWYLLAHQLWGDPLYLEQAAELNAALCV